MSFKYAKNESMLHSIAATTYSVKAFDQSVEALQTYFNYQLVEAGNVSAELAAFWSAPAAKDRRTALLQSASGVPVYVRFIENFDEMGHRAFQTFGWNATELHVQGVSALAESLKSSPYTIIGGPRDLMNNQAVIALQVRGPSDEIFFLAEINSKPMQHTYGQARTPIDAPFMIILGSHNHLDSRTYYAPLTTVTKPRTFSIRVLAAAHGLDPQTTEFEIGAAVLKEKFRFEIDGYPETATARRVAAGDIPPGLSMASATIEDLGDVPANLWTPIHRLSEAPYNGARCMKLIGPSGEWLELIEPPPPS